MKKVGLVLCLALVVLFASSVFAGTSVDFWVTMAGSDVPIHQAAIGGIGSTVTLSVWYSTDVPYHTSLATLFGWDRTNAERYTAVPMDNILTGSLASNIQDDTTVWGGPRVNVFWGGRHTIDGAIRPYGVAASFCASPGVFLSPTTGYRLYDVTLTNANLTSGSYTVCLWDTANRASAGGDCYVCGVQTLSQPTNPFIYTPGNGAEWRYDVEIVVPEPASMLALGSGLMGLVGFAVRRRRA